MSSTSSSTAAPRMAHSILSRAGRSCASSGDRMRASTTLSIRGSRLRPGDVVGFLNSDDYYEPGAFSAAAEAFAADPDCDAVCGSARLVADGRTIEVYDREEDKRLTSARTALLGACIINARFFRRPRSRGSVPSRRATASSRIATS